MANSPFPYRVQHLWRTRLLLLSFPIALLDGFFYFLHPLLFWVIAAVWGGFFLLLYCVYFPLLYRSLNYQITSAHVRLRRGVLFCRETAMQISNIQYLTLSQTPLQRLFHLSTLHFIAAGGSLHLVGLEQEEAHCLREQLLARMADHC